MLIESRLCGREWVMDQGYSIADISVLGWVRHVTRSRDPPGLAKRDDLQYLSAWMERCLQRPAVQRGLRVFTRLEAEDRTAGRPASGMPAF